LSLYEIINYHMGKVWVFIMQPVLYHKIETPTPLIMPVGWDKETYYLKSTNVKYTK